MTSAFDENWMLPRFDRTPSRPPAAPSTPGRAGKAAAAGAASVADVEATQEAMAAGNTSAVEASLHASGASPLRTSPRALDPLLAEWVDYVRTCESHGEAAAAGDATLRRRTCNPEPGTVSSLLDAWAAALRNEASPAATPATAMVNAASSSAPPSGRRRILEAAMAEAAAETAAEAAAKAAAEAAATAAAATTTTATSSTAAGTSRLAPRSVASPPSGEARAKPRPSMGTRAREAAAKTFKHLLWPLSPSRPARASSPASPGRSPVGRPAARPALRPLPTPSDDDAPPMLMMAPMGALSTARSPAPPSAQSRRRATRGRCPEYLGGSRGAARHGGGEARGCECEGALHCRYSDRCIRHPVRCRWKASSSFTAGDAAAAPSTDRGDRAFARRGVSRASAAAQPCEPGKQRLKQQQRP